MIKMKIDQKMDENKEMQKNYMFDVQLQTLMIFYL